MPSNPSIYEVLDYSVDSVRLLQIQDPSPDGVVRCRLRNEVIAGNTYRALSYVWNPKPIEPEDQDGNWTTLAHDESLEHAPAILINNTPLEIGRNLYEFLEVAQHQFACSDFWIDAVCIDQDSVAERNHQVGQMAKIYSNAQEVIAWLGPGDVDTTVFLNFVSGPESENDHRLSLTGMVISGRLERDVTDQKPGWDSHAKECDSCSAVETIRPGFRKVLRNQYWSRLWVVQEILLAKGVQIKCGRAHAPLCKISAALSIQEDEELASLEYRVGAENFGTLRVMKAHGANRDLYEMVSRLEHQQCSVPHDHLYGLLGVSSDCQDLEVDYSRTTAELTQYVLERANLPNFLCGSTIAKALQISPEAALTSLPPEFLDRSICIRETASYARITGVEADGADVVTVTNRSPLFDRLPTFQRCKNLTFRRCKNPDHHMLTSSKIPIENDVCVRLPKIGLKAVFRPVAVEHTGPDDSPTHLSFVCCMDGHLPSRETGWYCSIAHDLQARLELLEPAIITWNSDRTADLVWKVDWRTIFTISKYTGWKGYFSGLLLEGPEPEARWYH